MTSPFPGLIAPNKSDCQQLELGMHWCPDLSSETSENYSSVPTLEVFSHNISLP